MLADVLRSGFALAHRRVALVFLDLSWKIIWAFLIVAAVFLLALWVTADVRAIAWDDTRVRNLNLMIAISVLREFWSQKRAEIVSMIVLLLSVAGMIWVFLEASFRRKIVRDVCTRDILASRNTNSYPLDVFVISGILKYSVFFACAAWMALLSRAGAGVIAAVTVLALGFSLTLLETVIRADAVDLLGTDLFRVAGLLGILLLLEGMVVASSAVIVLTGFLSVTRPIQSIVMVGAATALIVFLNVFHSYLLLVRFSAISVMSGANASATARSDQEMRRNVVEV